MARLLNWPRKLAVVGWQPLSGPRNVGSSSSESITAYVQTTASAFGLWRWQFSLRTMKGALFRRYRSMVTGLHAGANAVRVPFCDPDIMSWEDSGVVATREERDAGKPFSNGKNFSNDRPWHVSRPTVSVPISIDKDDTIIFLDSGNWGYDLAGGEWIGFFPYHFGLYLITEVIEPGQYRIWPPLRKALVGGQSRATLKPVIVMRLENEAAATASRGVTYAESATITLVEVEDGDVRRYFTEPRTNGGASLREDGGYALREDGGLELKE